MAPHRRLAIIRVALFLPLICCMTDCQRAQADPVDLQFERLVQKQPSPWFVPTKGYQVAVDEDAEGRGVVAFRQTQPGAAPFGNLMRMLPADKLQGKRVRLSAKLKVKAGAPTARLRMWLRVDRPDQRPGSFDNMSDRPILIADNDEWQAAVIELEVQPDANYLAIGVMAFDAETALIKDVMLEELGAVPFQKHTPPKSLTDRGLRNVMAATRLYGYVRYFCPTTEATEMEHWDAFLIALLEGAEQAVSDEQLIEFLSKQLHPFAPELAIWQGSIDTPPAELASDSNASDEEEPSFVYWEHAGIGLNPEAKMLYDSRVINTGAITSSEGRAAKLPPRFVVRQLLDDVACRLPTRVVIEGKRTIPRPTEAAQQTLAEWTAQQEPLKLSPFNRGSRLADVAYTWNVFRHFYPYSDTMKVDWTAALDQTLSKAATDTNDAEFLRTLSLLVAKLKDGHGRIASPLPVRQRYLPLQANWMGEQLQDLVVTSVHDDEKKRISRGDIIRAINGRPVEELHRSECDSLSGATEGWLRVRSAYALSVQSHKVTHVRLAIERNNELKDVAVETKFAAHFEQPTRPANGSEVAAGIRYFNLVAATKEEFDEELDKLSAAKGIVFDLRGYPNTAAIKLLQHLITDNAASAKWLVPKTSVPDQAQIEWKHAKRWDLTPIQPHLGMPIAFLTDASAISYAESIMGIVEHYELGEIVGATTAGTNGNINPFKTPCGYQVAWTGMRVIKHDDSTHHGVGIAPTIAVHPTAAGVAEGRDEVLARAIAALEKKLSDQ